MDAGSTRSRHLHILVRRSDVAIQCLSLRMALRLDKEHCFHRPAALRRHCEERSDVAIQGLSLRTALRLDKEHSFHRPAALRRHCEERSDVAIQCLSLRTALRLDKEHSFHRPAALCRHCEERSDVAIQCLSLRTALRPDKEHCFHRPAAGEALFTAEKDPKRLAPGARRLGSCLADPLRILATAGRRRTHTSMCSNSGAYSLRLPAMLAALYGA
jgi:hypothetical protein